MIYLCSNTYALKNLNLNFNKITVLIYEIASESILGAVEYEYKEIFGHKTKIEFCNLLLDTEEEINNKLFNEKKEVLLLPEGNVFDLKFVIGKKLGEKYSQLTDNFESVIGVSSGCHYLSPTVLTAAFSDPDRVNTFFYGGLKKFNFLVYTHCEFDGVAGRDLFHEEIKKAYKIEKTYNITENGYIVCNNDGTVIKIYKTYDFSIMPKGENNGRF